MDHSFLLILVASYITVSIAWDLNMNPDDGGESTAEVAASLIVDNNWRIEPKEEKLTFGDNGDIEVGAIMPSVHQQVSPFVPHKIKTAPPIIPSSKRDAVKQRTRRMAFRTECIQKVKHFCKKFTVRGITKLFCVARKVFDCTALCCSVT